MKGFGSDNHAGIHPRLLEALIKANIEHAPSYGTDEWTERANVQFQKLFGKNVFVFFVYNGTSANALCIRAMTKPWQGVFCSDISHLNVDECGAPEFLSGAKLYPLPSHHGKISLEALKQSLIRRGDQHYSQVKAISLTQPTEVGTCYTVGEICEISDWAHSQGLYLHIDGARLSTAVVSLNTNFYEMITKSKVDVVSFGGTKNGLMLGEAVIFLNTKLAEDFQYIRKQTGQLPSKTRFIAAQFEEYLNNNLWSEISNHSINMAKALYTLVKDIPGVEVTHPIESNAVFAKIPQEWIKPLRNKYFFYVWDEKTFECRWMTSFDTKLEEVTAFAQVLRSFS